MLSIEKTLELIDAEIARIEGDDRFHYEPANVAINAPLALIQTEMTARMQLLLKLKKAIEEG